MSSASAPSASARRIESSHRAIDTRPPVARAPAIGLDPGALIATLEHRVAELSTRLHAMTTERALLGDELRLLRAGQKSAVEVTAALAARRMSIT